MDKIKIQMFKDFIGREIGHFNNDDAEVSYVPDKNCKFILIKEEITGEYCRIEKYYIIHIDINGNEKERFLATAGSVTSIYWAKSINWKNKKET